MRKIFLLLLLTIASLAVAQDYPTKTIGSKTYYVYSVEPGDGLFAIGRKFNVTQAELHDANPGLSAEIKVGQELLIPAVNAGRTMSMAPVESKAQEEQVIKHTVLPQQTLYAISKIYSVSIEQIKALNPGCENGIKVGDVLRIPVSTTSQTAERTNAAPAKTSVAAPSAPRTKVHIVKHKETLYSICKMYNVDMNDVMSVNEGLTEKVKEGQRILIPVEAPQKTTQKTETAKPSKVDEATTSKLASMTSSNSAATTTTKSSAQFTEDLPSWSNRTIAGSRLKVALLLPLMTEKVDVDGSSEKFVSFYKGAMLAMDELKASGVTLDVYTFDIAKDTTLLSAVLAEPVMKTMDLIIGPAYKAQVPLVSRFARQNKIYAVVPFTSQINNWDLHEYILQFNPSFRELYSVVAERIVKTSDKAPFVIVHFPYSNNRGENLAVELTRSLQKRKISYREISVKDYDSDSLATLIGRNKCNILIASNETRDARYVINQLVDAHLTYHTIWGFEEWSSLLAQMQDGYYLTLFSPHPSTTYSANYSSWFGSRPSTSDIPNYDLLGYDIMMYFGFAARHTADGVKVQEPNVQSRMQQSAFYFVRERYGKHFVNVNHYFVHWNGQSFSSPVRYK
ncbi:MAG: LysM peptidoglycan-binding domain-containing protein [Paludibacteraceae bacterium]|nr:LysM peptidoglycan-binding domain-containing protein [Paludibacteraceae bacterium]